MTRSMTDLMGPFHQRPGYQATDAGHSALNHENQTPNNKSDSQIIPVVQNSISYMYSQKTQFLALNSRFKVNEYLSLTHIIFLDCFLVEEKCQVSISFYRQCTRGLLQFTPAAVVQRGATLITSLYSLLQLQW